MGAVAVLFQYRYSSFLLLLLMLEASFIKVEVRKALIPLASCLSGQVVFQRFFINEDVEKSINLKDSVLYPAHIPFMCHSKCVHSAPLYKPMLFKNKSLEALICIGCLHSKCTHHKHVTVAVCRLRVPPAKQG